MYRSAVVGKERVQEWGRRTALWYAGWDEVGEAVVVACRGLLIRKSNNQLHMGTLKAMSVSLVITLQGSQCGMLNQSQ